MSTILDGDAACSAGFAHAAPLQIAGNPIHEIVADDLRGVDVPRTR